MHTSAESEPNSPPTELQPLQKGLTYVLLVSSGHCLLETSRASESMSGWGTYEKPRLGELTAEVCCKTQHSHGSNTTRAGASSQVLKQESEDSQAKKTQNICLDLPSVIPKVTTPPPKPLPSLYRCKRYRITSLILIQTLQVVTQTSSHFLHQ